MFVAANGALSQEEANDLSCEAQPYVEAVLEQVRVWDLHIEFFNEGYGDVWARYSAFTLTDGDTVFLTWTDFHSFEIDICTPGGTEAIIVQAKRQLLRQFEGRSWMGYDALFSTGFCPMNCEDYPVEDPAFWNEILGIPASG